MKCLCLTVVLFLACFGQTLPQGVHSVPNQPEFPIFNNGLNSMPSIEKQRDMIIKQDYNKNLTDSAELFRLADELRTELVNGDKNVVSVKAMKSTEEIEKLAHNIKGRLKRN